MNESFRRSFLHLAECHANAVADLEELRESGESIGGDEVNAPLAEAFAREKEARAALIEWKPGSNIEAQSKFLYVVQYLVSTRTSLDRQEMAEMMNSVEHFLQKERP